MKIVHLSIVLLVFGLVLSTASSHASRNISFGFNATSISGISGVVRLTGGGAYNPDSGFVVSNGGFDCVQTVTKGPLSNDTNSNGPVEGGLGCQAGEGVRWDTALLLPSIKFKCTGADSVHTATTGDKTAVLKADFYEASDGTHESFSDVPMIVSAVDLRPDLAGNQNVWIAGVGCGAAIVHFS